MLDKLPFEIEDSLILSYQFKGFIWTFSKFFKIEKNFELAYEVGKRYFYTWQDQDYRDFMCEVIQHLEPFLEQKHVIIANELDEFNEIIFINSGKVAVGYEINKQKRYCI